MTAKDKVNLTVLWHYNRSDEIFQQQIKHKIKDKKRDNEFEV